MEERQKVGLTMNKKTDNSFKYELRKGNGCIHTHRNLNWFEKIRYILKGYEVIKLN